MEIALPTDLPKPKACRYCNLQAFSVRPRQLMDDIIVPLCDSCNSEYWADLNLPPHMD